MSQHVIVIKAVDGIGMLFIADDGIGLVGGILHGNLPLSGAGGNCVNLGKLLASNQTEQIKM